MREFNPLIIIGSVVILIFTVLSQLTIGNKNDTIEMQKEHISILEERLLSEKVLEIGFTQELTPFVHLNLIIPFTRFNEGDTAFFVKKEGDEYLIGEYPPNYNFMVRREIANNTAWFKQ